MAYDILEPEVFENQLPGYDVLEPEEEFSFPTIPTPQFQTEPQSTTAVADIPYEPTTDIDPQYFDSFQVFQKETDPYKKAEAIKMVPPNEREKIIKTLPMGNQASIREKVEIVERAKPERGKIGKVIGAGVKEISKGIFASYDPYETEEGKEALEVIKGFGYGLDDFRDDDGKIQPSKINSIISGDTPGHTVLKMKTKSFLDAAKRFEEHPEKQKKMEEVGKGIIRAGEYLDPFDYKKYKLEERINSLKDTDNESAAAFERGDLSFVISQAIADAAIADDPEQAKQAIALKKKYEMALQEAPEKQGGFLKNIYISTLEMLAPMGKTGIKMAVPIIGQAWGGYEWARQGMGDVYADMIDAGVSHETAREISPIAGIAYAAVEQLQFGQLTKLAGNVTNKAAGQSIKKVLLKILKEKGKDFFKEVGEEGVQKFVTDVGAEIGKRVDGVSEKEMGQFLQETSTNVLKEMGYAAGPMGLLTLFGVGGAAAKVGIQKKIEAEPVAAPKPGYDIIEPEVPTPAEEILIEEKISPIEEEKITPPAKEPGYDIIEPVEPVKLSRQQKKKSDKFTQAIQTYESREEGDNLIIDWATNKLNAGDVIQVDQGEMTWTVSEKTISKHGTEYIEFKSGEATQNDFGITKRKNEDWKIINKDDARVAFTFDNRPEYAADNPLLVPIKEEIKLAPEEEKSVIKTFESVYKNEGLSPEEATARAEESLKDLPNESKKLFTKISAERDKLKKQLYIDNLTGLKSRDWGVDNGYFTVKKVKGKDIYTPADKPQVMIDIDNFKKSVNDKYGHPVGDDVLTTLGRMLNEELEGKAESVRFGGEEILTFPLTGFDKDDIIKRLERVRSELRNESFADGKLTGVSFSAGFGNTNKEADEALYAAKEAGKNQTHEYGVKYEEPAKPDTEGVGRVRKAEVADVTPPVSKAKEEPGAAEAPEEVVPAKEEPEELKEPEKITGKSEAAGQEVQVEPSEAQKEAGNYKKAHIRRDGFDISIENPAGTERSGKDKSGKEWTQKMYADYGYIKGSVGYDKDHVDVFIKPDSPEGGTVYIVNQVDPQSKKFDEHKASRVGDVVEPVEPGEPRVREIEDNTFVKWLKEEKNIKVADIKEEEAQGLVEEFTKYQKEKPDVSRVGDVVEPVEPGEPGVREGAKAEEPTGPEVERERKAVKPEGVKPDKERIEGGRGTGDRVSGLLSSGDTGGGAGRRGDEQANVRGVVDKGKPLLIDYLIDNVDNIGHGGAVTKTRDNLSAIKILKQIESENRYATPDEQQQLVRYVGWGGLSSAFKKSDRFYNELKDLLTEEEYNAARRSTLNAHYTSPTVIQSMWNGLVRMGYNGGNVLEPAIGIGHFFGLRPTTLKMAMSGIELDPISGRIARQLYQNADIRVQGYETFKMPKDYYQAIVSNVPFSDSKPVEPNEIKTPGLKEKVSLHDFYFLKSLYGLRPGGIIAFVTSRYTMDKKDSSIRKEITKQGDFIGAVRLPTTAFKENAGTEVVTDIIFIQKRAEDKPESDLNKLFVDTSPVMMQRVKGEGQKEEFVNKYYQENPDMVIGDQDLSGTMYTGDQYNVVLKPDISKEGFSDMLNDAVNSLPQNIISDYIVSEEKAKPQEDMDNLGDIHQLPTGSYFTRHGNVYQKASETDKPIKISGKNKEKLLFLTKIKENAQMLFASQRAGDTKTAKESLAKLNIVYDKFYKKYGAINEKKNDVFKDDPAVFLLYSLEKYDNEKKTAEKTALFKGVTFAKETPVEQTDSIEEALIVSLNLFGVVDVGHIAKMMDKDPVEIGDILVSDGLAFRSPEEFLNGKRNIYVTRDEYLSGNVRKKLEKSRQVAKKDPAFNYNVNELEAVIPADIPSERISIKINSPVIESTDIKDFIKESLDGYNISAIHNDFNGQWSVDFKTYGFGIMERDFGTPRMNAKKIMQNMMNGKKPKVYDVSRDMEGTKTLNETETAAAQVKAELLAKKFREWLWSDDDRKSRIVRTFNDRFNSFINRTYTHPKRIKNKDAKIFFPGSAFPHPAHPHQADAVWRIVQSKRTMLAHEVGSGKTLEMIWGGMEAKRLGLIKKPIYTFPNHMVKQWAKEFYEAYPNAKLLVAQEKDLSKEKRRVFINKIATGDWDAVLVKMEDFKSIPLSPTEEANQMQHFVSTYRGYIDSLDKDAKKQRTIKQLEKKLQNFEDKIAILKNKAKKEKGVLYFEDLGIDMLFVDEADLYKNLQYYTSLENVKGMGTQQGSGRAFNMFMKIQYLNRKNGRIIFATGTPISNTLVEAYTMMKFLQLEWLHDEGIESFDDWNRMFADTVTEMELDNTGSSYRPTTRFSKITNVPSLMKALREVWDIQTAARLEKEKILVAGRDLPHKKVINRATPLTDLMKSFKRYLVRREDSLKGARPEKGADNVLVIMDDGRKAAIDFRLFSPKLPDLPESKLNLVVNDTYEHYKKYDKQKYTQIIFIERPRAYRVDSDGKRHLTFDAVEDIKKKLIAKGIPENEIAWISDKKYEKDAAKAALFGAVRDGRVRVLIGSVAKMGAGTNVQDLGKAVRQVDAKYRPRDFTQSNGRFVRQGNKVLDFDEKGNVTTPKGEMGTVEIYNYTAKGSLDTGLWNMLEVKSRAINNIMENTESLDYEIEEEYFSSIKDLSIEDPVMKEAVTLRQRIKELTNFERAYIDNRARLRSAIKAIPGRIENIKKNVAKYEKDIAKREPQLKGEDFSITIEGKKYDKRKDAGEILIKLFKPLVEKTGATGKEQKQSNVGTFAGFPISIRTYIVRSFHDEKVVSEVFATGNFQYIGQFDPITKSPSGLIGSLNNTIYIRMDKSLESEKSRIRAEEKSLADAQASVDDKFEYEQELEEKKKRVAEVDKTLSERKEVTVAAEDEPVQWEDIRGYIPTVDTGKEEEGRIEDVEEDEGEPEEPTLKAKGAMFYSPTAETIAELKQEKGVVPQVLSMIKKGQLKKAEVEWMGLEEWLNENPKATKGEVLDFVRSNEVDVEESVKGVSDKTQQIQDEMDKELARIESKATPDYDYYDKVRAKYEKMLEKEKGTPTKYSQYTLPGGDNYRELLFRMPKYAPTIAELENMAQEQYGMPYSEMNDAQQSNTAEYVRESKKKGKVDAYKSSHWEEPNVFAHARVNDRTTPEGEKVLFIEEIQSDWAREAREKGVVQPYKVEKDINGFYRVKDKDGKSVSFMVDGDLMVAFADKKKAEEMAKTKTPEGVPDFPFKKNWHEFVLKRIIREAAEQGYDRVAWVTGEQTADRYDLSKQVSKVIYQPDNQLLLAYGDSGNEVIRETVPPENVANYIGKEPAKKLLEQPIEDYSGWTIEEKYSGYVIKKPDGSYYERGGSIMVFPDKLPAERSLKRTQGETEQVIEGTDLKIGGEWATNLYDKMIPKFLDKYAKKWGAKVETVNLSMHKWEVYDSRDFKAQETFNSEKEALAFIESGESDVPQRYLEHGTTTKTGIAEKTQQSLPITPAMKESVLVEGQPMFAKRGGAVPFKKDISEVMGMVSEDLKRNVDIVFARNYDKGKYSLKQGERGAIERVGDRIRVTINPALTSKEAARTLVHEVMGHFGVANVLRSNPDIHKRLIAIYNTQKNSPLIKKIRKEYAQEMKDNPKFAEDMVFSEWIAYSMEEYIANPKGKGVSYYVWRAIKQFLIKMGWREDTVENVMHDIVKELKTVRFVGPTYVAKVPVLKAKDYIPVVSYREEMLDDIYDSVSGEKKGLFRRIFKHEKSYQKIKDRIAADILVPISTRLKHIKPIFKEQIRRFEFNYHKKEYVDTKASQPFLNGVKKMEAKDQQILDYALKNTDTAMVLKIVTKYNLEKEFEAVRKVLDGIHENMRDVGFKINYVKDYWPRQVLNYSGLLKEVQDTEEWGIIEEQISKAEEKLKRPLSEKEKAEIVNFFIARPDRIIDMPGGAKKRTIDLIDEKIDKYYDYSMSALIQYIHNMNQSIEIRRFLGMDKDVKAEKEKIQKVLSVEEFKVVATEIVNNRVVDIEGGIGEYVMRAISEHNLTPQQQDELIGILKARFNYRPSGHTTQTIKDIGYITSMGSGFSSFITQIGDLTWAYYVAGPIKATKALARAFVGMSEVRKEHIGIERIAEEFRTSRGLGRILNKIFDWTLLTKMDAIGKEALINGVLYKYQQQAKKNDIKLTRLLQRTFGFEEGAEVMEDFKNKNITDNVKYLLFTKLLDFQPLALSEMPMKYLKSPGGRLFYMLKTFTIKQLDAFRNESIDYIKEGISAKNGKLILKGLINMAHLAALFVAANTGADELKDWLFGRKPSFSDKVWDNIFRLFGLSRYISWEVRRNGIVMAFWKLITPPMDIIEAPLRDSWKMFKENGESFDVKLKNAETWKIIPFFGKHYYWWFGGGRRREVKRQQKSIPKLNFARILKKETTTLEEKMTAYKYYLDLTPEQHKDFAKEIPGYTKQIRKIKKGLLGQSVWKEGEKRFVKMGGAVKNFKKREENLKERLKKGKISQADYNKTTKKIDKEREEYLEWKEQLHE